MGSQIVDRGGYPESLQGVIGWGVHLGVSIAYATLFASLALLPLVPQQRPQRWGYGLAVAAALAVGSTLILVVPDLLFDGEQTPAVT